MRPIPHQRATRALRSLAAILIAVAAVPPPATSRVAPAGARRCVVGLELSGVVATPDAWTLRDPGSIALDHKGDILIADTGNHRVVAMTREGAPVMEFGGYGWGDGQFNGPTDLSIYEGFFTYVLDEGNRRVERFDVYGDYVDRIVSEDEAGSPTAIAVGRSGELYLVDADSQTILVRSQFNEAQDPIGQFGMGEGGLVSPVAVAVGPRGEIGVADLGRSSVVVFDEFGTDLYELTLRDTLSPADVVFNGDGAVIVVESDRRRITAFAPGGGPATAALVLGEDFRPVSLALDGEGSLLVLDSESGGVLVIETTYGECAARR